MAISTEWRWSCSTTRAKAGAEDFVDMISGTNGLAGAADTILVVKRARGQADATLQVTGRDVEEQDLALQFDGLIGTWRLLGDADEWVLSETRRKLLAALREQGPLTPKALAEYTGIAHETVKKTLQRMAVDNQVVPSGAAHTVSLMSLCPPTAWKRAKFRDQEHLPVSPTSVPFDGDGGQRDAGDTLLGGV